MVVQRFYLGLGETVRFRLENPSRITINPEERTTCNLGEKLWRGGQRVAYSETADAYQLEEEH